MRSEVRFNYDTVCGNIITYLSLIIPCLAYISIYWEFKHLFYSAGSKETEGSYKRTGNLYIARISRYRVD